MESKPTDQDDRLLWIKCKPGAGKCTLMKMIIRQIESREQKKKPAVLHFFFDA